MSLNIYEGRGLTVTRYAGPADRGADRTLWKITTRLPEGIAVLRREEAAELALELLRDALSYNGVRLTIETA